MIETDIQEEIFIDPELLAEIEEESQVIVHCEISPIPEENFARIWPTTYLVDNATGLKYPLVYADGITMYPVWTRIPEGVTMRFSLYFKGLPKSCLSFDLMEIIPAPGAFHVPNIPRNQTDVYQVVLD
ncbi:hypothetical protein [Moheibacter stercoris]|uniref:Uncharacterized protein n=1 Tax=Moheibacter stercoris TaxID=1628251 RepID=A0ABV2LW35_9FLAO